MAKHDLKTWPLPFEAVWRGNKLHEIRENDRVFAVGDLLVLREWDPRTEEYCGRAIDAEVTYMTRGGSLGLPEHLCVMSIRTVRLRSGGAAGVVSA